MKLLLAVILTMIAFAANSILNRMALASELIDPASFAAIRIGSGVLVLTILLLLQRQLNFSKEKTDFRAVAGLTLYMLGFSFAYMNLDAGIGALILFGSVQITMFVGAILKKQQIKMMQWLGAIIAFAGLIYLLLPGEIETDFNACLLMLGAGLGWGIYSLRGQLVSNPLQSTWKNFLLALLPAIVLLLFVGEIRIQQEGLLLAIMSGGITSALGYALWYKILPELKISTAAVSQLTVPIIAMIGGILFLNETLTITFVIASVLVLGGIALSVFGGIKK